MNRILFTSLIAVLLVPFFQLSYKVLNIEGSEHVTINGKGAMRDQTVGPSDLIFICGTSKLSVKKSPNGNPIEISSADMIDRKPTKLTVAIDMSLRRHDKRPNQAAARKGAAEICSNIAVIDGNGTVLNGSLAGKADVTKGFFKIVNESKYDLFYMIGWYDTKGFRYVGSIIPVKSGETFISGMKKFSAIEKGEMLSLYASMDRYQSEQFQLIDYVEF